jgi:hypothetical protein
MRRGVAALAAVSALAVADVAAAAVPIARDDVDAGLALAGSRVVWGSTAADGSLRVRAGDGSGPPVTLFAFPPTRRPTTQALGAVAASSTHLALVRHARRPAGEPAPVGELRSGVEVLAGGAGSTTLIVGPLGGPFLHLAGTRGATRPDGCEPSTSPSEPVISGTQLAYLETVTRCTRRGARQHEQIVLYDLARPRAGPRVVAHGTSAWLGAEPRVDVGAVRLAGRYVAWQETYPAHLERSSAKVLDLRSGRVVRTVRRAPGGSLGDILEWFAVGRDGSLVVSYQKDETGHGLALVPRDGRAGPVEVRPPRGDFGYEPTTFAVAYRRGRIAFVGETGEDEFGLVLARRTGIPSPLARFTAARPIVGDPAWNGAYATWAARRGRTTTIWRARTG